MRILAGSEALVASGAAHGIVVVYSLCCAHRIVYLIMYASLSWSTVYSLQSRLQSLPHAAEVCRINRKILHGTVVVLVAGLGCSSTAQGTPEISTGGAAMEP